MSAVLGVIGPIFALIALGYLVTRFGLFQPADLRALGRYTVMLALPALIFRAVTARDLGTLVDPGYLAAYLGGSLLTLALGYGLSRRAGLDGAASTFQAMGMACANSGFMGYPVLLIAMPAVADSVLALNMIAENLVLIPLVLVLAEASRARGLAGVAGTVRRVATNPIVLALVAGLTVALSGAAVPQAIAQAIDLVARSSAAVSLIVIGGALSGAAVPRAIAQAIDLVARSSAAVSLIVIGGALVGVPRTATAGRVAAVVAGKLALHPLAVAAVFAVLAVAGVAVDSTLAT